MSHIITITASKGGAAKTTTAVLLSEALAERGYPTTILDIDPQGSAGDWAMLAASTGEGLRCEVVAASSADEVRAWLPQLVARGLVVVDTPPYREGDPAVAAVRVAVEASSLVLVPSAPSDSELRQALALMERLGTEGRPAALLLNRAQTGTRSLADAQALDVLLAETVVPHRQAILRSYGYRPEGAELQSHRILADEVLGALGLFQPVDA